MATGLREGWTGSSVVIYGHLFEVTEHERTKVKLYDAEWESSDVVEGPPLPEQIGRPFCVNCWEHKIYVIGQNLHVAVGRIWRLYPGTTPGKKHRFSVQWQIVATPGSHYDPRPSSAQIIFAYDSFSAFMLCAVWLLHVGKFCLHVFVRCVANRGNTSR